VVLPVGGQTSEVEDRGRAGHVRRFEFGLFHQKGLLLFGGGTQILKIWSRFISAVHFLQTSSFITISVTPARENKALRLSSWKKNLSFHLSFFHVFDTSDQPWLLTEIFEVCDNRFRGVTLVPNLSKDF
jgi:hypothetical protein